MAQVKHTEFSKMVVQAIFQGNLAVLPANLYIGLAHGALPGKSGTLADVLELTGNGYARKLLTRNTTDWPTLTSSAGDWKIASKLHEFDAIGDYDFPADYAFICDVAAGTVGRLFLSISVPEPFRLLAGDSFENIYEYVDR